MSRNSIDTLILAIKLHQRKRGSEKNGALYHWKRLVPPQLRHGGRTGPKQGDACRL